MKKKIQSKVFLISNQPIITVLIAILIASIVIAISMQNNADKYDSWEAQVDEQVERYQRLLEDPNIFEESKERFEKQVDDYNYYLENNINPYSKSFLESPEDFSLLFLFVQLLLIYTISKSWSSIWNSNMKTWYTNATLKIEKIFSIHIVAISIYTFIISICSYLIVYGTALISPLYEINLNLVDSYVNIINNFILFCSLNLFIAALSILVMTVISESLGILITFTLFFLLGLLSNFISSEYIIIYYFGDINNGHSIMKALTTIVYTSSGLHFLAFLINNLKIRRFWFI